MMNEYTSIGTPFLQVLIIFYLKEHWKKAAKIKIRNDYYSENSCIRQHWHVESGLEIHSKSKPKNELTQKYYRLSDTKIPILLAHQSLDYSLAVAEKKIKLILLTFQFQNWQKVLKIMIRRFLSKFAN